MADHSRRPADDTRCPTCGGSAHALSAEAQVRFGGATHRHRGWRKGLDSAWAESDRLAGEIESTYAHIRAVIENCKHQDSAAIRHQLVGLLPEVRGLDPDTAAAMRAKGLGHLVDRSEAAVRDAWREYGYGDDGDAESRKQADA